MTDSESRKDSYYLRSFVAGGIAGGIAKTAVAPLDRVKILFQTHNRDFARFQTATWRGGIDAIHHIIRTQGFLALYRGNTLTLARAVPYAAIGYTTYDAVKPILMPTPADQTPFRRMIAGSIAGISALPFIYPFELARVRMAIMTQHHPQHLRLTSLLRSIYKERVTSLSPGGLSNFYRGFLVTVAGQIPYRGGIFLTWETLNYHAAHTLSPAFRQKHQHKIHLSVGALSGAASQILTYPLEVVRKIQQASGHGSAQGPVQLLGFNQTVAMVWRSKGWRGFYAGLGIGLVKQVPMHSISLAVWQAAKEFLDIS